MSEFNKGFIKFKIKSLIKLITSKGFKFASRRDFRAFTDKNIS
ncbi:hypothetical protein ATCC51561_1035 [Campylobacter concisus ATCC 51561]|nr:hypothetical protein ATCC51561_1035 [Campylobacter concisus ATCC 51561]